MIVLCGVLELRCRFRQAKKGRANKPYLRVDRPFLCPFGRLVSLQFSSIGLDLIQQCLLLRFEPHFAGLRQHLRIGSGDQIVSGAAFKGRICRHSGYYITSHECWHQRNNYTVSMHLKIFPFPCPSRLKRFRWSNLLDKSLNVKFERDFTRSQLHRNDGIAKSAAIPAPLLRSCLRSTCSL
jgi:hypothetical protein